MITVLTPTYNRAHTLPVIYESLCAQSFQAFEWLIVDDGSQDGTEELIRNYRDAERIKIRYQKQKNAGKHGAINTGVNLAEGDWIFIVDSDDMLTNDAINVVENSIDDLDAFDVVGICFRRANFNGSVIGEILPNSDKLLLTPTAAGKLLKGDLAYIFKTAAIKKFPFPVIEGEKFVPELYIWNKVSDIGKIYFYVNKYIYLCEYLEDGYTKNFKENLKANPRGFMIYYTSQIFRETEWVGRVKCVVRSFQCALYYLRRTYW